MEMWSRPRVDEVSQYCQKKEQKSASSRCVDALGSPRFLWLHCAVETKKKHVLTVE